MDKKDKQILKDTALVIADQIATSIPALNIAWGLSKALFGAGMKLRQQKALEWVEMIRDNPEIFTEEILKDEKFQDGFVFILEKYLIERSEEKRKFISNIFMGFTTSENKENFPLEKFAHTISQLSIKDIYVLRDIDIDRQDKNYQIYGNNDKDVSSIYNLLHLGLLLQDSSARLGPVTAPFVWISSFGKEFIKYIQE